MPLVDVECRQCGQVSEVLVRRDENLVCPECQSSHVERRIGIPSIGKGSSLPVTTGRCAPSLPPCGPGCCRIV